MKLTPTETLYESRLFEVIHRTIPRAKIWRQLQIRCKGCGSEKHRKGKLWIVDFYIWPKTVIEVDGHLVNLDRDNCLRFRGLKIMHVQNRFLYHMGTALGYGKPISQLLRTQRLKRMIQSQINEYVSDVGGCVSLTYDIEEYEEQCFRLGALACMTRDMEEGVDRGSNQNNQA